ncbi:MAG TPA: arginine deiminase family protein [Chitinophagales bacterium]|nr:arginine deiminase family protein [Chitinophagales bacterium]
MLKVSSEYKRLRKVIIHAPDDGIEIVTPSKALEFLYDDIVFLPQMQAEHAIFRKLLAIFLGEENVYDTQTLLKEVLLLNEEAKIRLADSVCRLEKESGKTRDKLRKLPADQLVYTLFTGMLTQDNKQLFSPLPNYVFTRDIGAVVNDHIIICNARKKARSRESILTRFIVQYHPLFRDFVNRDRVIDLTQEGDEIRIEGGDIMMYDPGHLLVGCSSRTTYKAVELLAEKLFRKNVVANIIRIDIPKKRASMHIDTLFTQVSENEFVVFAPYVFSGKKLKVYHYRKRSSEPYQYATLKEFFLDMNPKTEFILCGNGKNPYDEREQWTDGCNLLALNDGVAIAYNRNAKTAEAFKEKGYNVVDAEIIINAWNKGIVKPGKMERTIMSIPSTELSRARGGPHCLSFPIERW